ncbi:OB-fold nucleic acid binding domain protein, partial [Mycobacterium kansasii 662]
MPRYACYEDARLIPKVGVASVIAEGFLVLPFSRRNKAHTGHHPAVPEPLAATGLLHHDGSAPDITELQQVDLADDEVGRRLPEQVRVRLNKLKTLRRNGIDAYPVGRSPSHTVAQAMGADDKATLSVSGRILRVRHYGGVLFAHLRDWTGEMQLLLDNSCLQQGRAADFNATIDLGDLVEMTGHMGSSKRGTRSLIVSSWRLIGKCLRPLPNKWKGLTDPEARVRTRYVDLAVNAESRDLLTARSTVLRSVRETTVRQGFHRSRDSYLASRCTAEPPPDHSSRTSTAIRWTCSCASRRSCTSSGCASAAWNAYSNWAGPFGTRASTSVTILSSLCSRPIKHMPTTWCGWTACRELIQNAAQAANGAPIAMRPTSDGLQPVDISGVWPVKTVYDAVSEALGEHIHVDT